MDNTNTFNISILLDLLEQHSKIHYLSIGLSCVASMLFILLIAFSKHSIIAVLINSIVIFAGLYETYLAIRIGFDINLFKKLTLSSGNIKNELKLIDDALIALNLMTKNKAGRELPARLQAVKILFKKQIIACLMQLIGLILIGISYR